jgi:DNA-binding NarL/FixJ family response regulator
MTDRPTGIIRVLCVDDHPIVREGIAGAIREESDMTLVGEATSGEEAIVAWKTLRPDVTLMDLQMSGMNGSDAIVAIRKDFPGAVFIVLTTYSGDVQAVRALRAGASGYLLKSMLRKELLDSIRQVHAGKRYVPPEVTAKIMEHYDAGELTARELEVLRLIANGHSNKITGQRLSIAEDTVKNHVSSIMAKLGASDRTHAVTLAIRRGFLEG